MAIHALGSTPHTVEPGKIGVTDGENLWVFGTCMETGEQMDGRLDDWGRVGWPRLKETPGA